MAVWIVIIVVPLIWYGIQFLNRGTGNVGNRSRKGTVNNRLRAQENDLIRQRLAARELMTEQSIVDSADYESSVRRPLGVVFKTWSDAQVSGVQVASVAERSAAERIGLRAGAQIVSINDRPVANADEAAEAVEKHRPGLPIFLVWQVDGAQFNGSVIL